MNISIIEVTKENMMNIVTDDSVYVIKRDLLKKDRFVMKPVKGANVEDLMSDKAVIIKIAEE